MKIAIASGKGGTGKTTVSVNLARRLSIDNSVLLMDGDVEAPNCNIFFKTKFDSIEEVKVDRPVWNKDTCINCSKCVDSCNYNALINIAGNILMFDEMCHSCGACLINCNGSLKMEKFPIGKISTKKFSDGLTFCEGRLNVKEVLAPTIIKTLKKKQSDEFNVTLIDAPPGNSCSSIAALRGSDYAILVTEPTPFGLHDLKIALNTCAEIGLKVGIVINRSIGEDKIIEDVSRLTLAPIVGRIPFKKEYAATYSVGKFLVDEHLELKEVFDEIYVNLINLGRCPIYIADDEFGECSDDEFNNLSDTKKIATREIVVISGKGGTGKTTITSAFSRLMKEKVMADNDVDASNLYLTTSPVLVHKEEFIGGKRAVIDTDQCNQCGLCADVCHFEAIKDFKVDHLSCEGCGACKLVCEFGAIQMEDAVCGEWMISKTDRGYLSHARLGVSEDNSGKLVSLVRNNAQKVADQFGTKKILNDGPPGVGCPVIAAISGVDFALIVTEPTMSGLSDLKRVMELCAHFRVDHAVVINKYDLSENMSDEITKFVESAGVRVIGRIPFDRAISNAQNGVTGRAYDEIEKVFKDLQQGEKI